MSIATTLITAAEFAEMPDTEGPCELIRGEVFVSPPPSLDHGDICAAIVEYLRRHVREKELGRVFCNDAGVITEREPDTVRGPDVFYYSYEALPKGDKPYPYAAKPPELVFEVRSPSQSWPEVHAKVAEYLAAGVLAVCVVDGPSKKVVVHHSDRPSETLEGDGELRLPEVLGDFSLPISRFFE